MAIRIVEVTSTPKRIDVAAPDGYGDIDTAVTGRNSGNLAALTTEHRYHSWPFLAVASILTADLPAAADEQPAYVRTRELFEYAPLEEITIKRGTGEQVWAYCLVEGQSTHLRLDDVIT